MKTIITTLIAVLLLAGCSLAARVSKIPKPEGRYAPAIYAVTSEAFSSDRASTLSTIAAKPDISEAEQIYLLEVLRATGGFSNDVKQVLLSLVKNRAATDQTKKKLSEFLPQMGLFSGDAKEVADAIAG